MSTEPIVKPAPKPRTPMSDEAKERARLRARAWYEAHKEQHRASSDAWEAANPDKVRASAKKQKIKQRDAAILAAPVIHDADRFERIAAVMASYKERKGEQQ